MKLKDWLRKALLAASVSVLPALSFAQGVPTIDTKSLLQELKMYEQMLKDAGIQSEQLTKMIEQIELLEEQLAQLEEIESLLSDPTSVIGLELGEGLDGILEGDFDENFVSAIISGTQGDWSGITGSSSETFLGGIESALTSAGTSQDEVTALAGSDNPIAKNNATATTSAAATSAAAEVAYEEASQSVQRVTVLVDEIPELDSLKKSVDHNTRVTAELAIAMAAMWQLESVQTINNGMGGVLDAATAAEIQKFNDFTLPEFD